MRQVAPLTMWSDHLTIWPADQGVAPLLDLNIEPVLRTNLSQVVAEALLQLIRKGDLKPGDQLPPERELMRRFNVSRSTVREGLKSLAMVNVLDIQQGRGAIPGRRRDSQGGEQRWKRSRGGREATSSS